MTTAAPVEPVQHEIELPNGVVLAGVGGDSDSIQEQAEDRQDERSTGKAKPVESKPDAEASAVAPVEAKSTDTDGMSRTQRRRLAQEKIDNAIGKQRDAERRADAAEQRIRDYESRQAAPRNDAEPAKAGSPTERAKPIEDEVGTKYASYADFVEDLADWKSEQKISNFDAQLRSRIEAERASRSLEDRAVSVVERGRQVYADFDAVQRNPDGGGFVPLGPSAEIHAQKVEMITSLPNAEHIIYEVCKSKALAQELAAIASPFAFGVRIAQLANASGPAAEAAPARPSVSMTNAAPPMQPVGTSSRTSEPSLDELANAAGLDYDSSGYREKRRAQLKAVR